MGRDKASRKDYVIQVHILLDAKMEDATMRVKFKDSFRAGEMAHQLKTLVIFQCT